MLKKLFKLDYSDEKLIYKNTLLFTFVIAIFSFLLILIKEVWFTGYFGYFILIFIFPTYSITTLVFIIRGLNIRDIQIESKSVKKILNKYNYQRIILILISIIIFFAWLLSPLLYLI